MKHSTNYSGKQSVTSHWIIDYLFNRRLIVFKAHLLSSGLECETVNRAIEMTKRLIISFYLLLQVHRCFRRLFAMIKML